MTCYVAAQPHKRNHDRKIHQSPFNGRTKMNRVTLKSDTGGISRTVKFSHQSDSLDHVLDMAADGADCGQLLPVAPPFIHTELRKTTKQLTSPSNSTKSNIRLKYTYNMDGIIDK